MNSIMSTQETNRGGDAGQSDLSGLRGQAVSLSEHANTIRRIANETEHGTLKQLDFLDKALGSVNEMAASLKHTAERSNAIATSTDEVASSISETAASLEQMEASAAELAMSISQTSTSFEQASASIQNVGALGGEAVSYAGRTTSAVHEIALSIASVSRDTASLNLSINETATTADEISRASGALVGKVEGLNIAAEQTSSAINGIAASMDEAAVMSESFDSTVGNMAASIEEIAGSMQDLAVNSQSVTAAAGNAASSAELMEQSIRSVAALAKDANELTKRVAKETEDGAAVANRSMQGMGRVRDSVRQSATAVKEMERRANEIGSIVETINLIAERTNMLSLNAAIEAARAGDAGPRISPSSSESFRKPRGPPWKFPMKAFVLQTTEVR
jgi:methyl-accepting chemotaxis protein